MGMDLEPVNPSADAPRRAADDKYSPNEPIWGRYNCSGWSWILEHLEKWGVDTSDFAGSNDDALIPESKCREVADAIEAHIAELDDEDQKWLREHIQLWRTCGGYIQH